MVEEEDKKSEKMGTDPIHPENNLVTTLPWSDFYKFYLKYQFFPRERMIGIQCYA